MSSNLKGINIELGAETKGLDKALADVNKRARDSQVELRKVDKLLKLDPKNTELVAQKQKLLADAVSATREKLDSLKAAQQQVADQFARGEIGEEQYRDFQREIVKTEQELKRLETAAKKAGSGMAKSLDNAGKKMQVIGDSTMAVGTSLTRNVTGPLLAAGAAGVALGGILDDAFDKIRIGTGATGERLDGLKDDFRSVFGTVPNDAGEVSTAIADLNTRLDLTGAPLQELAKQFLTLSRLTGTDLTGNIEAGAAAFAAFDIPATDYAKSLDLIFKTSQSTGIGIGDLFSEVQSNAPVLRTFGLGFEQSAALMGTLKKAGAETEPVMAGLKKGLATMAKEGVTDANQALGLLFDRIKAAPSDMEGTRLAIETFGAKAGPALASNIREGKVGYEELLASLKGSKETIGAAAADTDDWKERLQVLSHEVINKLEPALTQLFDSISKAIPTIKAIADKVVGLVDAFAGLDPGKQKLILGLLAGIAVLGPLIVIIATLISSVGTISVALGGIATVASTVGAVFSALAAGGLPAFGAAISAALGPVGLIIAAIAALIAIGVLVWKNWDHIKAFGIKAWEAIKTGVVTAATAIWSFLKKWGPTILAVLTGPIGLLVLMVVKNFDKIKAAAEAVVGGVKAAFNRVKDVVGGIWTDIVAGIKSKINGIIRAVNNVIRLINTVKSKIPGVSALGDIRTIPQLAAGGIVTRPTLALVGERGPEGVVPLDRLAGIIRDAFQVRSQPAGAITVPQQITFNVSSDYDMRRASRVLAEQIVSDLRARGLTR